MSILEAIQDTFFYIGGTMITGRLLTATEVATILGVSRSKAYHMMRQREIPTITIGKNVRVSNEDLEGYIVNNREYNGEEHDLLGK